MILQKGFQLSVHCPHLSGPFFLLFVDFLTGTKKPREQKGIILSLEMEINYCICTVVNDYKRRGIENGNGMVVLIENWCTMVKGGRKI